MKSNVSNQKNKNRWKMTEEMDEKQFMEKFGLQSFGVVIGLTIPEKNDCDGKLEFLEL